MILQPGFEKFHKRIIALQRGYLTGSKLKIVEYIVPNPIPMGVA
jgi:hypothetical protein